MVQVQLHYGTTVNNGKAKEVKSACVPQITLPNFVCLNVLLSNQHFQASKNRR